MSSVPESGYVATRKFGDAAVTVISEGSCLWAPRYQAPEDDVHRALPDADAQGRIRIAFNLAHIRIPGASVLIDPGFDDPASAWDAAFGARWPGYVRTPGMMAALASLSIRAADVTHVLISHAHDDHFAGVTVERDGRHVPRFARARHFIGRQDWEDNPRRSDPASELMTQLGAIDRQGALELVEGEREVAPGIGMIHAPGETAGHCTIRVRSGGDTFFYAGDLFHHACEVEHPDWVSPGRDPAVMRASRERLITEAAGRATVVFTHEPFPAWGRIVRSDSGYRWERTG